MIDNFLKYIPKRKRDAHKGSCGEVFLIAGSSGMIGAAVLASRAALRAGCGLVKLAVPKSILNHINALTPEVITLPLPLSDDKIKEADVLAVGPGLGKTKILKRFLGFKKPIVIDADGLNSIASDPNIFKKFKGPVIITPHPGELSRLLKMPIAEIQKNRKQAALEAAKKWNVICVLKGSGTIVAAVGAIHELPQLPPYLNKTGNPGMATAGAGDVLCGMIASFIAQGVKPYNAAVLGVYIHGLAGDIAAKSRGIHGLIASDIIEAIPSAILKCTKK